MGISSEPLKDRYSEQIRLVLSSEWIDFDALDAVIPELGAVMDSSQGLIDLVREDAILRYIVSRIEDFYLFS